MLYDDCNKCYVICFSIYGTSYIILTTTLVYTLVQLSHYQNKIKITSNRKEEKNNILQQHQSIDPIPYYWISCAITIRSLTSFIAHFTRNSNTMYMYMMYVYCILYIVYSVNCIHKYFNSNSKHSEEAKNIEQTKSEHLDSGIWAKQNIEKDYFEAWTRRRNI